MALNHTEQMVLGLIIDRYSKLAKEADDLEKFLQGRESFKTPNNGDKIQAVSVARLHLSYPIYELTLKLVEFTELVTGYLRPDNFISYVPQGRGYHGGMDEKFRLKLMLLKENGVEFEFLDEHLMQHLNNPRAVEDIRREQKTIFGMKVNNFYVDFDYYPEKKEIKGIDDEVYTRSTFFQLWERNPSSIRRTQGEIIENYERRVIREFARWGTDEALNFLQQTRHLRRQGKDLKELVIQAEITSFFVPEPQKEEEKK